MKSFVDTVVPHPRIELTSIKLGDEEQGRSFPFSLFLQALA